jgi:uncharacterized membrane protein
MSVAQAFPAPTRSATTRWLLLGSLALNLFFIGVAFAIAIRAPAPPPRWDPDVFVRVDRLAATLPLADADILRGAMQANHDRIVNAQAAYHHARDDIRQTLRQDPFNVEDMRAAIARIRMTRQNFDQVIHGVFADTVAKMSPAARYAIANWRTDS